MPETEVLTLADIGCQVLAVGPSKLFPKAGWLDATCLLQWLVAGKLEIKGGDKGVIVNMSLPVTGKRGAVIFQSLNVFIHLAEVGDKVLLGLSLFPAVLPCLSAQSEICGSHGRAENDVISTKVSRSML